MVYHLLVRTYAKSSNFGIFNPLNPPYQGDFKRECVSPIGNGCYRIFNPLNPPYQGDFKRECVSPIGNSCYRFG